jgi:NAD(P)-dependent dehydrogenase (short-subunit alcohol dehydrogenase family)
MLDRLRLDGKRLFITGGSRGLGREMALAIADAGADVVLTGRDADSLARTAEEVRRLGRQAFTLQADLADPAACETVCAQALAQHGPLDILINNLGGRRDPAPIEDMPLAQWQALIDLNLTSSFICTKAIGGAMVRRGRGGRIINIASINAFVAGRGIAGIRERTPMQTFGAPEDLGPLAVYLASDAARFMTGAALVIDGGYTLW